MKRRLKDLLAGAAVVIVLVGGGFTAGAATPDPDQGEGESAASDVSPDGGAIWRSRNRRR